MTIQWERCKDDTYSIITIDLHDLKKWIIIENKKGQLCFIRKDCDVMFSISRMNRKGQYKLYKNNKFITSTLDVDILIKQITDYDR